MIVNPGAGGGSGGLKVVAHGTAQAPMNASHISITPAIFAVVIPLADNYGSCFAVRGGYINSSAYAKSLSANLSADGSTLTIESFVVSRPIAVEYWAFG